MLPETIKATGHTTQDGMLHLTVDVGIADADVAVTVQVTPLSKSGGVADTDWPEGYFEQVAGSMPELQRAPQGLFEERLSLE